MLKNFAIPIWFRYAFAIMTKRPPLLARLA